MTKIKINKTKLNRIQIYEMETNKIKNEKK